MLSSVISNMTVLYYEYKKTVKSQYIERMLRQPQVKPTILYYYS